MDAQGLRDYFAALPDPVRQRLLYGSVGFNHLLETARQALKAAGEKGPEGAALFRLGSELALEAWTFDFLNPALAADVLALDRQAPFVADQARQALAVVARDGNAPDDLAYYQRLAAKRQPDKLAAFARARLDKEPDRLWWRSRVLTLAAFTGDWAACLRVAHMPWPEPLAPLARAVAGNAYFFLDEPVKAYAAFQCLAPVFGPGRTLSLGAACLGRMGKTELAAVELGKAVEAQPWRTNDRLMHYELAFPPAPARLKGGTAVLLYTFNKADSLDRTLAALAETDLDGAHVTVLDNGSTDATAQVLSAWEDRLGRDLFTALPLPVNVGAPAARNWLAGLPETRERRWAMYLDDDAALPRDWNEKFAQAENRCPRADVYGLKVADAAAPWTLQAVDYHLAWEREPGPDAETDLSAAAPTPFRTSNLHLQCMDMGFFDYVRPCVSVTGCCHLMRTRGLADEGFSIMLSPSQYDDLERDLRLAAKGGHACYQGGLGVLHEKRTGAAGRTDRVQEGQAMGNRYKMQVLHPAGEIREIMARDADILEADLADKAQALAQGVNK